MTFGQIAFAIAMIASGALNFFVHDFYSPWDPIPKWIPAHPALAYASGALMIAGGAGLLVKRTAAPSARVLFAFLALFWLLGKTPIILAEPQIEVRWLDYGQIATLVAGAWALATTDQQQLRAVRYLLGAALIPIGLSHFFDIKISIPMVPAILPFHAAWVIFTGIAHIAAGVAILVGVYPRLAAMLEGSMVAAFGVFVWLPPIFAKPGSVDLWENFVVSIAVAAGVWAAGTACFPSTQSRGDN